MLSEYFPPSHIQQVECVEDWQQAVNIVARPLLDERAIEPRYVERIVQLTKEIGPYYVIAPYIAMPHSRPEDGAHQQALSLLVVKQGVNFGSDNDPVHVVLMLAAKDSESHLEMLSAVAEMLGDDDDVQQIIAAPNNSAIADIIHRY